MSSKLHQDLKQIVHPFMFVLKEGKAIGNDLLDYSLMMLHVNCLEVIKTPKRVLCELSLPAKLSKGSSVPAEAEKEAPIRKITIRPKA